MIAPGVVSTVPCPECHEPLVGARVFDPKEQEAFIGLACTPCEEAFRVLNLEES